MTMPRSTGLIARLECALGDHLAATRSLSTLLPSVADLAALLTSSLNAGRRVFTFGNGGSAAEAQHFAGELIGRFRLTRAPLAAVCLAADAAVLTCIGNDFGFDQIFARQVLALAGPGDVTVAFTSTGRSPNVVDGLAAARSVGATTVLFSSGDGGPAVEHADISFLVLDAGTARVQESHQLLMHMLSEAVDEDAGAHAPTADPAAMVTNERAHP